MKRVKADFVVKTKGGIVQTVGKSFVEVPKTNFKGGSIKWYKDKPKQKAKLFYNGRMVFCRVRFPTRPIRYLCRN